MQYIEAPVQEKAGFKSVFLAGGITNCPDWQKYVADKLAKYDITVFNPRRKKFPTAHEAMQEQISWEYERLRTADIISFWFSSGSLNPIVLFELGAAMERNANMVVGLNPDYERRMDVEIQVGLRKPKISIKYSLDELIKEIEAKI